MTKDNAILSISPDGIKINTPSGTSLTTNSTKAFMQNVQQESNGGEISHNSADLTQIGGSQTAKNAGKITNRVEGGTLRQENITQSAESKGEILNEVKKKLKIPLILAIIAVGADLISYYFLGIHIWDLFTQR